MSEKLRLGRLDLEDGEKINFDSDRIWMETNGLQLFHSRIGQNPYFEIADQEYSKQMDHLAKNIQNSTNCPAADFESGLLVDQIIDRMMLDMKFPKFILGQFIIGVHPQIGKDRLKPSLSTEDLEFLRFAVDIGVDGIVLDNHPVAIETANFLQEESDIAIFPMILMKAVVDKASSAGLSGVVKEMASSVIPLTEATIRSSKNK